MPLSEKRTQIYLPLETHRALKARARRDRTSMAEAVREALGQYLAEASAVFDPAKDPILKLAGFAKDRDGATDVSVNHHKYLIEALEKESRRWRRGPR